MIDPRTMYQTYLSAWSDVQSHLSTLHDRAQGTVLELGTRYGISTCALLTGVSEHGGQVWSVDINPDCGGLFDPPWHFVCVDSRDKERIKAAGLPLPLDLLFVDTQHTYEHTLAELECWLPELRPGGTVLLHDTDDGATYFGVRQALYEYCMPRGMLYHLYPGSYGLGVIQL